MARIIAKDSVTFYEVLLNNTTEEYGKAISTLLDNPLTTEVSVKFETGHTWTYYKETA